MIIGHKSIVDYFESAWREQTLAHTYCLVGLDQVGKRTVARHLAAQLLGVAEDRLATNPDFYLLERLVDEKTGQPKKELSVAQARDLCERLSRRSWLGGYQVTIIDEAELLNAESSNALLKVLEEPPLKSVVFLLVSHEQELLPTIRSRVQLFYLSLVNDNELQQGLQALGWGGLACQSAVAMACGRPGLALDFLQDETIAASYRVELERWQKLLGQPFATQLKLVEPLFTKDEVGVRGQDRLQKAINWWMMWSRKMLLQNEGVVTESQLPSTPSQFPTRRYSTSTIVTVINQLINAQTLIEQNVHPRLVVENILTLF